MADINREELAWAAGFFDGEGCFYVRRSRGDSYLYLGCVIPQVDRFVLDRFLAAVGTGQVSGPHGPYQTNRLPQWHYHCRGKAVTHVFTQLEAFLSPVKKKQYNRALEEVSRCSNPKPAGGERCWRGHTEWYVTPSTGRRRCLACARVWKQERRAKKVA